MHLADKAGLCCLLLPQPMRGHLSGLVLPLFPPVTAAVRAVAAAHFDSRILASNIAGRSESAVGCRRRTRAGCVAGAVVQHTRAHADDAPPPEHPQGTDPRPLSLPKPTLEQVRICAHAARHGRQNQSLIAPPWLHARKHRYEGCGPGCVRLAGRMQQRMQLGARTPPPRSSSPPSPGLLPPPQAANGAVGRLRRSSPRKATPLKRLPPDVDVVLRPAPEPWRSGPRQYLPPFEPLPTLLVFVAALVLVAVNPRLPSITGPPAETKPFDSFAEFYPHYLKEHVPFPDSSCRAWHIL